MTQICDITQVKVEKFLDAKKYLYFLINETYHLGFFLNKNTTI